MSEEKYIVATIRPWNLAAYHDKICRLPGSWSLVSAPEELSLEMVREISPRYIFFPHWSWKVDQAILAASDCVCFHETDLPFGRGGSPIQNLISRGYQNTQISALKMGEGIDEGPIYLKKPLSLEGSAEEIFGRSALLVADMIAEIIQGNLTPKEQEGEATLFKRRQPEQSEITSALDSPQKLYDHIRMLDAPGYPKAFLPCGEMKMQFTQGRLLDGKLKAEIEMLPIEPIEKDET